MKTKIILAVLFISLMSFSANAQGTWTQVASIPPAPRIGAVAFSIGSKGYVGTGGLANGTWLKDFWEYDAGTNNWTQKANFGGTKRVFAVGFSIGSKGYIGTGFDSLGETNDFWEYDTLTNSWIQKANFASAKRSEAVGFSIGNKGYIGTGVDSAMNFLEDFWEYDPLSDSWTQKTNYGGGPRIDAVGFSMNAVQKGFIVTGEAWSGFCRDLWEYDPLLNVWTQKADFGGCDRDEGAAFAIDKKGYVLAGDSEFTTCYKDIWEYDYLTDTWCRKLDFPMAGRQLPIAFSIGDFGYFGTGADSNLAYKNDLWKYTPGPGCYDVGINETNTKSLFSVLPNPSSGIFTIQTPTLTSESNLEIYNSLGRKIRSQKIISEKTEIDLSDEANGIYFVSIRTAKEIFTEKIVIMR